MALPEALILQNEAELEEAVALSNLVFRTSEGKSPIMGDFFPNLFSSDNLRRICVVKVDGRIVSLAAWFPEEAFLAGGVLKIGKIGSVATHADHRKKGYSTAILRRMLDDMKKERCSLSLLWTGIPDFYRRLGFEYAGVTYAARISELEAPEFYFVRSAVKPDDIANAERLRASSAHRARRSAVYWERLLDIPGWRMLVAETDEQPVAYAVLRAGLDGGHSIGDFAGCPRGVQAVIASAIKEGISPLPVYTSWFEYALRGALAAHGVKWEERVTGMFAILDAALLTDSLTPWFLAKGLEPVTIEKTKRGFRIGAAGKTLKLNALDAVKVLFHPEDVKKRRRLPFPYRTALPVPLYCAGIDHV